MKRGRHYFERWGVVECLFGLYDRQPRRIGAGRCVCKKASGTMTWRKRIHMRAIVANGFGNGDKGWTFYHSSRKIIRRNSYGNSPFPISNTLENAYSERCLSRLAAALGKRKMKESMHKGVEL